MLDVSFLHVFLLWSVGKEVKKKSGKFCEKSREKSGEIGWGKSQEKSWEKSWEKTRDKNLKARKKSRKEKSSTNYSWHLLGSVEEFTLEPNARFKLAWDHACFPISLLCLLWGGGYDTFINLIMCNVELFLIGPDTMHWEQFCFIGWRLGFWSSFYPLFSQKERKMSYQWLDLSLPCPSLVHYTSKFKGSVKDFSLPWGFLLKPTIIMCITCRN